MVYISDNSTSLVRVSLFISNIYVFWRSSVYNVYKKIMAMNYLTWPKLLARTSFYWIKPLRRNTKMPHIWRCPRAGSRPAPHPNSRICQNCSDSTEKFGRISSASRRRNDRRGGGGRSAEHLFFCARLSIVLITVNFFV